MNGDDLQRRIGQVRAEGKVISKLSSLWQRKVATTRLTAADCAKAAKDPLRRLEPLRRRDDVTRRT
jgi:hypothetical protein